MRYKITYHGFPTVTISKMEKGDKVYAEPNSCIASSPIFDLNSFQAGKPTGSLLRKRLMTTELEGAEYKARKMPTRLTQAWEDFKVGTRQTTDRLNAGENPYVSYEALEEKQKITFRSCFPGTIMRWTVKELEDDEVYLKSGENSKSVLRKKDENRPHGIFIAVRGSFLVAEISVKVKPYHTNDPNIQRMSMTSDSFQRFSGTGSVCLEVHGDLVEIPLYPHEAVDIFPGHLLGFTEGVTLEMKAAGDKTLRNEENNDYVIRLTAPEEGGYVYANSVSVEEFFKQRVNQE